MVSRCIKDVQLVNIPSDAVKLSMKVFNSWCVLVVKPLVEKPRDDGRLPNFSGAENDHPVAILGRNVEVVLGWRHFLNHRCSGLHLVFGGASSV